jgi:hypothetical protein
MNLMRLALTVLFALCIRFGFGVQENPVQGGTQLITGTWYLEGREGARIVFSVDANGKAYRARDIKNWAIQAAHSWQLSAEELTTLKAQIAALPPSEKETPTVRDRVVIWIGSEKSPRVYSLKKIPAQLLEINKIAKQWLPKTSILNPQPQTPPNTEH